MSRRRSLFASVVAGLMLGVLWGCGTASSTTELEKDKKQPDQAAGVSPATTGSDNPGIDLQCAAERIRKAPAPFHWSFRKVVPPLTNGDWEADISADSITGTIIDSSGTRFIHGDRSDSTKWNTAVALLTAPLPASTFALVNNSSAVARSGPDEANGKVAIRYEIDTSQDTPAEASLIGSVLGSGGFVKGAAWVTRTGCPIKFVLNVEQHNKNSIAQREHYEANVTKR